MKFEDIVRRQLAGEHVPDRTEMSLRFGLKFDVPWEGLDAGVLDSVELIAKPKCHFNARVGRGVIADVAHLHVATLGVFAHFEVLNNALAGSL